MTAAITLKAVEDRTDDESQALLELSRSVYPPESNKDWPGRHLEWAGPQWDIPVTDENGILVSYTGVTLRDAIHNDRSVQIGGIGGVKTHPAERGHGYAAMGLQHAVEFFGAQPDLAFALLVCEQSLIEYYSRFGWNEFEGRLMTFQHGETLEFAFNNVMVLDVHSPAPTSGTIDLLGLPW
jgi:predicted GNAT family N-acyltransferase